MEDKTTENYWKDWLKAFEVDPSMYTNDDFIEWVNDMEEVLGEFMPDMIPDEWLADDDEWEDLPSEEDDD